MEFKFEEYKNEHAVIWNSINNSSSTSSFLTSLDWIEFQKERGKETKKFLIKIKEEYIGILYLEIYRRKTAKFAYAPYNPVVIDLADNSKLSIYKSLKIFAQNFIKEHKLNLFRFDPLENINQSALIKKAGFIKSYASAQAQDMWEFQHLLDPSPIEEFDEKTGIYIEAEKRRKEVTLEEELLAVIKKDTRYYINRAIKLGVKVKKATTEEEVIAFGNLMKETTQRKGFINFDTSYYLDQWKALQSKGITEIYLAEYQGKYLAGALMNFHKDTVYYAHGASTSDPEFMKVSAPYVLHFEMMKDAQSRGIKNYNFWGVVPKGIEHDYRGLSDFKMKFPGTMISYVGPYEIGRFSLGYFVQRIADCWNYRKERYRR